jgi:flagellar basal body-associated protein FliL
MSDGHVDPVSDASADSWQRNRKLLLILGMVLFIVMDVLMVLWFFKRPEAETLPASDRAAYEATPNTAR